MLRKFRKFDEKGASAIEFAILLPIFIFLIFSIIEFGFLMFINSLVNNAVTEAGRLGITGSNYEWRQNLNPGETPLTRDQYIEKTLKEKMGTLADYGELDIKSYKYSGVDKLTIGGGEASVGAGGSGQMVAYNVTYTVDILSPILMPFIGTNGKYVITARTIVQNEDFDATE
jgi:Flp pilus assembly protein TadG